MTLSFTVTGLDPAPFAPLFALDEAGLLAAGARRQVVDAPGTFPCRVSLDDARPGERVVLVNHQHQPAFTPFRSAHAIYVREGAGEACRTVDVLPPALERRILSLRCFDAGHMIVTADLVDGADAIPVIHRLLDRTDVAYIHAHYAKYGCYAARIDRA
ncbi:MULTISPECIES: DUF1203 domain-containing protein [Nitrospirillum]|uniref:Uncharacterized protein DUF1203 n=1 Tax=Nitrospirillum amazonense TaxID=28077 RepID=A0A560G3F3_9PROT|nr:DUF1203 domain-containing protein [Nitrospirillum amazonense]MEC4594099.1 DUF1203 domain-containing protein [Nitrospirillum amazonense]TWB28436.1 uncharacterized protein DUF1203 [Nitrospirillum amazonense]